MSLLIDRTAAESPRRRAQTSSRSKSPVEVSGTLALIVDPVARSFERVGGVLARIGDRSLSRILMLTI